MAYQKRDERFSVVDVELGVPHTNGRLCGGHDGYDQPAPIGIRYKTRLDAFHEHKVSKSPPQFPAPGVRS